MWSCQIQVEVLAERVLAAVAAKSASGIRFTVPDAQRAPGSLDCVDDRLDDVAHVHPPC
jgi:hypothetical protein